MGLDHPEQNQRPVKNGQVEIVLGLIKPDEEEKRGRHRNQTDLSKIVSSFFLRIRTDSPGTGKNEPQNGDRQIGNRKIKEKLRQDVVNRRIGKQWVGSNFGEDGRDQNTRHVVGDRAPGPKRNILPPQRHQVGEGGVLVLPHTDEVIGHRELNQIRQNASLPEVEARQRAHNRRWGQKTHRNRHPSLAAAAGNDQAKNQKQNTETQEKGRAVVLLTQHAQAVQEAGRGQVSPAKCLHEFQQAEE